MAARKPSAPAGAVPAAGAAAPAAGTLPGCANAASDSSAPCGEPCSMNVLTSACTWLNSAPKPAAAPPVAGSGRVAARGAVAGVGAREGSGRSIGVRIAAQQALHEGVLLGEQVAVARVQALALDDLRLERA